MRSFFSLQSFEQWPFSFDHRRLHRYMLPHLLDLVSTDHPMLACFPTNGVYLFKIGLLDFLAVPCGSDFYLSLVGDLSIG
jgi:hypothetical protein